MKTRAGGRQRSGARRGRRPQAQSGHPGHLAAGQQARRHPDPGRAEARPSRPAGGDDQRPRHHRDRRVARSSTAPTTSSRSRSRPTGCCWWSSARIEAARLRRENEELRLRAGGQIELIGDSSAINQLRQAIERVAPDRQPRADHRPGRAPARRSSARLIHARSRRADGPFVGLNCATMRPDRLEIELFGTEHGQRRRCRARSAPSSRPMAARCCWTRWPTCRWKPRARSSACCRSRPSSGSAEARAVEVDVRVIASTQPRPAGGDRGRAVPRGPVLPPQRRADPGAAADASGARISRCWPAIS